MAPPLPAERDLVMADLEKTGRLSSQYQMDGMGPTQDGHNAGGDKFYTDGMLDVGVLKEAAEPKEAKEN